MAVSDMAADDEPIIAPEAIAPEDPIAPAAPIASVAAMVAMGEAVSIAAVSVLHNAGIRHMERLKIGYY